MYKVECKSCGRIFQSPYEHQAHGCAADVDFEHNKIICGYGSKHDLTTFIIAENIPDWLEQGYICDGCIDVLLENKHICLGIDRFPFHNA